MILNKRTKEGRKPIPKKRSTPRNVHSERTEHITGHRRIRLKMFSAAWKKRREEIFARAGRYCEEVIRCPLPECNEGGKAWHTFRCPNRPTEWSHKRHGANKCDCVDCGIASCRSCHDKRHRPKACPRKELA